MFEAKLFQVEAVDESVDEPNRVFLVNVLVDGVWERALSGFCGSVYVFAHGFSVVLKLALRLTVSSEHKRDFSHSLQ